MQNEPMLCVQDLSVRFKTKYGSAAAVNHVSFSLKKGEKLGLVGESGSGKSVTSKSIIRLLPTPPAQITGSIRLNGEELLTKTERQMCRVRGNQISMIFQEPMVSLDPLFPQEGLPSPGQRDVYRDAAHRGHPQPGDPTEAISL